MNMTLTNIDERIEFHLEKTLDAAASLRHLRNTPLCMYAAPGLDNETASYIYETSETALRQHMIAYMRLTRAYREWMQVIEWENEQMRNF